MHLVNEPLAVELAKPTPVVHLSESDSDRSDLHRIVLHGYAARGSLGWEVVWISAQYSSFVLKASPQQTQT